MRHVLKQSKKKAVHNSNGAIVGQIKNGWLEKRVDPTKHMMRSPEGYATDIAHINMLQDGKAQGIRLKLPDGSTLQASTYTLVEHGIEITRGHGLQLLLPIKWWATLTEEQPPLQLGF